MPFDAPVNEYFYSSDRDSLAPRHVKRRSRASLCAVDDDLRASLFSDLPDCLTGVAVCGIVDCAHACAGEATALRAVLSVCQHWCWGAGVDFHRHRMIGPNK